MCEAPEIAVFSDPVTEQDRLTWCAWFGHHGIDPGLVPLDGWIERDEQARRLRYLAYVRNERGNISLNEDRSGPQREVRTLQLEAVPSPFPAYG